ncbi:fasciclin domain-containing protein [Aquiflexum gelatinilyticum]|uniref:Fasciclin domain-containing protein n=1 Tax=Aquiflexum gelatinilyticum TaxID=2961943 RepID=A0A9X2T3D5_9BACT|nr:fasciclin domain-containing protein [Aquiflexum gelatinilyticum]MCR9016250.1 fasciclin domain-containing protein [Aquiflexum gelatinilyticum]MCS4435657.1 fasciclin domain-containing protein [Aquiflexum gelatinilyticum]
MKTIRSKWSLLTLSMVFLTLVLFSSCNEEETPTPDPNIVEVASANNNFSTLVTAVQTAGLVPTLSGTGPFTVFAPTNEAFNRFLTENGLTADQLLASDGLSETLTYHVVGASVPSTSVTAGKVTTVSGDPFYVSIAPNNEIWINGNTKITATDVPASNGIIHVLDNVITPPTQNIAEIAIASTTAAQPEFTQLVAALVRANLAGAFQGGFDDDFTVFAPTDAAFQDLYTTLGVAGVDQIPLETLTAVLQYHVVPARAFSQDLRQGASLPTLLTGQNLTVNLSDLKINDSGLVAAALNIHATNGVIHVIDKVLLPE